MTIFVFLLSIFSLCAVLYFWKENEKKEKELRFQKRLIRAVIFALYDKRIEDKRLFELDDIFTAIRVVTGQERPKNDTPREDLRTILEEDWELFRKLEWKEYEEYQRKSKIEEKERRDMKNAYVLMIGSRKSMLIQDIARWILERHDHIAIEVAETTLEAERKIIERNPNLVIADTELSSDVNAFDLLKDVTKTSGGKLHCVLLNVEDAEVEKQCYRLGFWPVSKNIKSLEGNEAMEFSMPIILSLRTIKEEICKLRNSQ